MDQQQSNETRMKKKIKKRSSHFVQIKPIFEINDAGVGVIVQALQLTFRTCDFHFKINKTDHLLLLCCSAYTLCCRILNDISMKKKHKYHFVQNCRFDVFVFFVQSHTKCFDFWINREPITQTLHTIERRNKCAVIFILNIFTVIYFPLNGCPLISDFIWISAYLLNWHQPRSNCDATYQSVNK